MHGLCQVEWRVLYCTLSTNIASFMLGYSLGFPSPIAREVKSGNLLDDYQFGVFSGIFYLSAAVSGLCAIPMMFWLGRKPVIMSAAFISTAGWILLGSSRMPELLICARAITGLGCGLSTPIVPIYVAELANKNTRGRHLSVTGFAIAFGILMIYILGIKLSYSWLAVIGSSICLAQSITLLIVPYTPAYLASRELERNALDTLQKLRSKGNDTVSEIHEIITFAKNSRTNCTSKLCMLFKPHNLRALIVLVIMVTNQLSGINLVASYSSELLNNERIDPNILGLVLPLGELLGSILNLILVDKIGRKILLLISFIGIAIALLLLAIYLLLIDEKCPYVIQNMNLNYSITDVCVSPYLLAWPLLCFALFSTTFSLGIGNVSFILLGELIPLKMKDIVSGLGTFLLFLSSFLLVTLYPVIIEYIPRSYVIVGLSCAFIIFCVVTYILTPETKGKSVAELENIFKGNIFFLNKC